MTAFMRARDRLRIFIEAHEIWLERIKNGFFCLLFLLVVAFYFGYAAAAVSWWMIALLVVAGCFLPQGANTLILLIDLLLNLMALSTDVAMGAVIIIALSYLFCGVYQCRKIIVLPRMITFFQLKCPFVVPMETALLGGSNDVVAVICGGVLSFYLKEVHDNAALFSGTAAPMSAARLITDNMISNPLFFVYMAAVTVMFLVVYAVRGMNISHAWLMGVISGVFAEFIIMLAGYLFMGMSDRIITLVLANLFCLFTGIMTALVFFDLDYGRIEKVQFEDDEYYYYVTAVPKIKLAEESREIKTINESD